MNRTTKAAGIAAVALAGYHTLVRPRIVNWGTSSDEQGMQLPGDDIASGMPPDYTKAVTINAPPEAVWPWLAQVGDHRQAFTAMTGSNHSSSWELCTTSKERTPPPASNRGRDRLAGGPPRRSQRRDYRTGLLL